LEANSFKVVHDELPVFNGYVFRNALYNMYYPESFFLEDAENGTTLNYQRSGIEGCPVMGARHG
jgi:hypothetical protein